MIEDKTINEVYNFTMANLSIDNEGMEKLLLKVGDEPELNLIYSIVMALQTNIKEKDKIKDERDNYYETCKDTVDKYNNLVNTYNDLSDRYKKADRFRNIYLSEYNKTESIINGLKEELKNTDDKLNESDVIINKLKEELKEANDKINSMRNVNVNCDGRINKGDKLAYREDASREVIMSLKSKGMSNKDITSTLDISRATLWRRVNNK